MEWIPSTLTKLHCPTPLRWQTFVWTLRWIYRAQGWGFCHKSCEPNWQKKGFILRKVKLVRSFTLFEGVYFISQVSLTTLKDEFCREVSFVNFMSSFFKISEVPLWTWKGGQCAKRQPWPWIEGQHRKRAVCSFHWKVPICYCSTWTSYIIFSSQEVCWLCELHC